MPEEQKTPSFEDLTVERLKVADGAILTKLGLYASHRLQKLGAVCLMVDVLGRIRVLKPEHFEVKERPRIEDSILHQLTEEQAIHVLKMQGDKEEIIVEYLKRRDAEGVEEHGR